MEENLTTTSLPLEYQVILHKISIDNPDFDELRPSFMALAIIMSVVIILGNSLVLLLFYQERRSLKIAHKYIVSMAVCDLFMGLLSVPTQIFMMDQKISAASDNCPWILGTITALVQTSLTVLVASSIDRYWAVRLPHHYRVNAKEWVANCIIIASWIIPCSFGLSHYLTARPAINKRALCFMGSETYNPDLLKFLIYGIMPFNLTFIVVLYILIHREMTKLFNSNSFYSQVLSIVFQRPDADTNKQKNSALKTREIRTTILLLITVALAFITFIPGTAIGYVMMWQPHLLEVKSLLICYLLLSINSVFNPFIYAFNIRNVRAAARRLVMRIVCCRTIEETEITSSSGTALETSQTTKSCKNDF